MRDLFEREAEAVCRYVELALTAPSTTEARVLLGLAKRRLADAAKVAVPEQQQSELALAEEAATRSLAAELLHSSSRAAQ